MSILRFLKFSILSIIVALLCTFFMLEKVISISQPIKKANLATESGVETHVETENRGAGVRTPCVVPYLTPNNLTEIGGGPVPSCYNSSALLFKINDKNELIRTRPYPKVWKAMWIKPSCFYYPIRRTLKSLIKLDIRGRKIQIKSEITILDPTVELIHVWCGTYFETSYEDYLSVVQIRPKLEKKLNRARKSKEFYNVVIIGQDSTSHMNFIRTMPEVHKFLKEELNAVEFHNFNSLGRYTYKSFYPLMTGMELTEFEKACHGKNSFTENCPFIWKEFEKQGFRTAYDEDQANRPMFRGFGGHPFLSQPFHYDFRAAAEKYTPNAYFANPNPFCSGPRLSIDVLLDNVIRISQTFQNKPYWFLMWAQYLSHRKYSLSKFAEPSMLSALKHLHNSQLLNQTIVILFGDHGMSSRYYIKKSHAAFLEQLLPMLYIYLPKTFRKKYNQATKNLQENSKKLTTAFDVHELMKDLLNLADLTDKKISERSQEATLATRRNVSLFLRINPLRTCSMAGIPRENCACQSVH